MLIDSTRWEKFWVSDGFYGWQPPPYTKQIYGRTVWMGTTGYFITMGQFGFLSMNNGSTLPPDSGCSDPTVIYCPPD